MSGSGDEGRGDGSGEGPGGDLNGFKSGNRRKNGIPYKFGNTREDGSYRVGKNRTPPETRFQVGDGRKRGRRGKGVENADTFFERELARPITVRENGKDRKVTKGQSIDLRLIHNAGTGDNKAIDMVDQRRRRIAIEKEETARRYHPLSDVEILERYLRQRADELNIDPTAFGDPAPTVEKEPDNG